MAILDQTDIRHEYVQLFYSRGGLICDHALSLSCSPFGSIHHFFAFSAAGGAAYMFKAKGESERASERARGSRACPSLKCRTEEERARLRSERRERERHANSDMHGWGKY